jgi:hypothetical protein
MDAKEIIGMLVGLVHELYPDAEYAELYEVEEKLALANKFLEGSK